MNILSHFLLSSILAATTASAQEQSQNTGSSTTATYQPCAAAPLGMACVAGGPATIGADDHGAAEKPKHKIDVSTFYIDKHEVTAGAYKACARKKACPRLPRPRIYKTFQTKNKPAVPITWEMAQAFCVYVGKRLPTEAEWEKAARGGENGWTYPWGNDAPTCDQANFKKCVPRITKKVGSYPAGAYGVFDLAGNGYEWVKDWSSDCYSGDCRKPCGEKCQGLNPRGPCDGASKCKGHRKRVLKGGSWYWPADQMRGAWRRGQYPKSGIHRLSFRCASSTARLTAAKPKYLEKPRAARAPLLPPEPEQLAKFNQLQEDTEIFNLPECERVGKATTKCRDPMSYLTSNEALQYVWRRGISNLGGGYVGIGSDQSYNFIAEAKSEWAWIFDYDPQVVRLHQILRIIILKSETRRDFRTAFTKKHYAKTKAWITEAMQDESEEERLTVLKLFRRSRVELWGYYSRQSKPKRWVKGFGWLQNEENYTYIRTMYAQGRIRAIKGNMLTDVAMPSIAASARALGVPIRLYYVSNAEEQWRDLPAQYRQNVAGLPFDDESVVLRTLFTRRYHEASSKWHYILHGGRHLQEHIVLDGYANVWRFMEDRQRVGAYPLRKKSPAGEEDAVDAAVKPAGSGDQQPDKKRRRADFLSHIGMPSVTKLEAAATSGSP